MNVDKPTGGRLYADSARTSAIARQTKQVVLASQGVLVDRKLCQQRTRALALFAAAFIVLAVTPLTWWSVDTVMSGEHPGEITSQIAFWFATLCPALIAAVLVAGWLRTHK